MIMRLSPTGGNIFAAVKSFDLLYLIYLLVLYYSSVNAKKSIVDMLASIWYFCVTVSCIIVMYLS